MLSRPQLDEVPTTMNLLVGEELLLPFRQCLSSMNFRVVRVPEFLSFAVSSSEAKEKSRGSFRERIEEDSGLSATHLGFPVGHEIRQWGFSALSLPQDSATAAYKGSAMRKSASVTGEASGFANHETYLTTHELGYRCQPLLAVHYRHQTIRSIRKRSMSSGSSSALTAHSRLSSIVVGSG